MKCLKKRNSWRTVLEATCCWGIKAWGRLWGWLRSSGSAPKALGHGEPGYLVRFCPAEAQRSPRPAVLPSHSTLSLTPHPPSWLNCGGWRISAAPGAGTLLWGLLLARDRTRSALRPAQWKGTASPGAGPGLEAQGEVQKGGGEDETCGALLLLPARGRLRARRADRAPVILQRGVPRLSRTKAPRSDFPLRHLRFSSRIWFLHTAERKAAATRT